MIPYEFHPEARAEFVEAAAYYELCRVGLGHSFVKQVERAIAHIRSSPKSCTPDKRGRRRLPILGFPYSVVYRYDAVSILVLAVAHQGRRPAYWRSQT